MHLSCILTCRLECKVNLNWYNLYRTCRYRYYTDVQVNIISPRPDHHNNHTKNAFGILCGLISKVKLRKQLMQPLPNLTSEFWSYLRLLKVKLVKFIIKKTFNKLSCCNWPPTTAPLSETYCLLLIQINYVIKVRFAALKRDINFIATFTQLHYLIADINRY